MPMWNGTNFLESSVGEPPYWPFPSIYIFAKKTSRFSYKALYVGQTENLSERMDRNENLNLAKLLGMTHVHYRLASFDKLSRLREERELIRLCKPPLNHSFVSRMPPPYLLP